MPLLNRVLSGSDEELADRVRTALHMPETLRGRAAVAPRELVIRTKATIAAMATIDDHDAALERELEPQLWSVSQPEFRERLAAMQAKTKKN